MAPSSFPHHRGDSAAEFGEWISYFITNFIINVITYPCWYCSYSVSLYGSQNNNCVMHANTQIWLIKFITHYFFLRKPSVIYLSDVINSDSRTVHNNNGPKWNFFYVGGDLMWREACCLLCIMLPDWTFCVARICPFEFWLFAGAFVYLYISTLQA